MDAGGPSPTWPAVGPALNERAQEGAGGHCPPLARIRVPSSLMRTPATGFGAPLIQCDLSGTNYICDTPFLNKVVSCVSVWTRLLGGHCPTRDSS